MVHIAKRENQTHRGRELDGEDFPKLFPKDVWRHVVSLARRGVVFAVGLQKAARVTQRRRAFGGRTDHRNALMYLVGYRLFNWFVDSLVRWWVISLFRCIDSVCPAE